MLVDEGFLRRVERYLDQRDEQVPLDTAALARGPIVDWSDPVPTYPPMDLESDAREQSFLLAP